MRSKKFLNGFIKRHPDGFGFFIPDDKEHADVYVPKHSMKNTMTNDKVMIEVFPEKNGDRFRGEVIKILSRGSKRIVGRYYILNVRYGYIKDEGKGWGQDLKIKIEDSMNAQAGELVAADITSYPDEDEPFGGVVTEILGKDLDPIQDIRRTVLASHIPIEFSKKTLDEVKGLSENPLEADFKNRKDLRLKNLITIDGATAKDFDDAVLTETTSQGFLLYVAIADVSHYVKPNTSLDDDAYDRGTSVYFPNYVIPMLPEILSNGLCSLKPHVPRLCLVAEIHLTFAGEVTKTDFYEAVMESKARVTYGEAQEVIDGVELEKFNHVKENILRCADLAKILMTKRFREGSLDLEIPENEIVIDGSGVPIDIIRSERLFAHRLIEELMLAANVAVATFFTKQEIPALYRIHDQPHADAIRTLEKYLHNFGSETKLSADKLQKKLTKALEEFSGKPESQVLNILTLRSMNQAKYSMNNVGHFGLGFEFYTHFTSPIRRYPDLIVHRLLKNQVIKNSSYRLMSEDDLQSAGVHLSGCEQRSVKAERQVQSIKKARFMEKFVGEEFEGMISSVARFGVFVLLRQYDVDGLIRLEDLGKDRFEFDEENVTLVSPRTGVQFTIGDAFKIKVASVDTELGQINFVPSDYEERMKPQPKKSSDNKNQGQPLRNPAREAAGNRQTPWKPSKRSEPDNKKKVTVSKKLLASEKTRLPEEKNYRAEDNNTTLKSPFSKKKRHRKNGSSANSRSDSGKLTLKVNNSSPFSKFIGASTKKKQDKKR